jgi:hypothetical protein
MERRVSSLQGKETISKATVQYKKCESVGYIVKL